MNQGKLEAVKRARMNIDILGISELKWTGMGEFNTDGHYYLLRRKRKLYSFECRVPNNSKGD